MIGGGYTNDLEVSFVRLDNPGTAGAAWTSIDAVRTGGAGNTALTFEPEQTYLAEEGESVLIGYYPRKEPSGTTNPASVIYTITGDEDIMATGVQTGSLVDKFETFTFSHLLTQLQFKCVGSAGAISKWTAVASIKVKNVATGLKLSLDKTSGAKLTVTGTAIPHKEDVMTSFARGVSVSRSSRVVTLETFRRQCALLVFNVAPSPENALPFDELYGTRLELSHISVSGATLIAGEDTGILPTGGENKAEATVVFESGEFVVVEAGSDPDGMGLNKTTGIVLPKNDRPFGVEIDVQRNHETATLKATIDQPITFDAGKRYVFTLEVKNDESCLNLKIIAWNAISFSDGEVGAPPGGSYPDPDIQEGIGTTITVARWTKIEWSDTDVGGGE